MGKGNAHQLIQRIVARKITFTKAPITPKLVSLKYSKGLDLLPVLRKGYRYNGIWAAKNEISGVRSLWNSVDEYTHLLKPH